MTKHEQLRLVSNTVFFIAQILLLLGLYAKGYLDFMRSLAATTFIWIIYTGLEYKYRFYMDNYVRMLVMTAILTDGFFGYYLEYYVTSFVFDKIQHAFGTYAFAFFAYVLTVQLKPRPILGQGFIFVLVTALGISIGAIYEIVEFLVDRYGNPIIPSQASLLDTNLDIICDMLGAMLAAVQVAYAGFLQGISAIDEK